MVVVVTVTMVSDETMAPNKETHFGLISLRQMEKHYHQLVTFVGRDGQALSLSHNCWSRWTGTISLHYHRVTFVSQDGQALSAGHIQGTSKKLPFVKMGRGKYYC